MKDINKEFPIGMENIEHIIKRVAKRYPAVEQHEIAIITKVFFESIRQILFSGNSLSLGNVFTNMRLYHFNKIRRNKFYRIVKVKLTTSDKIKYV
jgi:ABC-type molybdate transport system ATPase subunit